MRLTGLYCALALGAFTACSDSDVPGDPQTPPTTGRVDIEAWLAAGHFKQWTAEPTVHLSRDPSPHGFNRIWANDILVATPDSAATWPQGTAAVKELYESATSTTPIGVAVYLKVDADSKGGDNWYWYERIPVSNTQVPHDSFGVVADGMGSSGTAKSICVSCHKDAGLDAIHTPTPGGRDQVYTPL